MEQFLSDFKEYKENYFVSANGIVYNTKSKKIIKHVTNTGGYSKISISINGNIKAKYVHRLVAELYIPNPENKPEVNHINGIKTDNRVENLEWCTRGENARHGYATGLNKGRPLGISSVNRKLNYEAAQIIRKDREAGLSLRELAKKNNISTTSVRAIINNLHYNHA